MNIHILLARRAPQSIARLLQFGFRHAIATYRGRCWREHRKLRLQSTQRGGLWARFLTWQRERSTMGNIHVVLRISSELWEHHGTSTVSPGTTIGFNFLGLLGFWFVLLGFLGNSWTSKFLSGPVMAVPVEDCSGDSRTSTPKNHLLWDICPP